LFKAVELHFLNLLVRPEAITCGAGLCFFADVYFFIPIVRSPRCVGRWREILHSDQY